MSYKDSLNKQSLLIKKKPVSAMGGKAGLFMLFSGIFISLVLYIFYSTELKQRLEFILFDIRTQIKPQILSQARVAVVTVQDQDLEFLSKEKLSAQSTEIFLSVLEAVEASSPEAIALLLPHQDFDYESPHLLPLVHWVQEHPNTYLGIFDYNQIEPSKLHLPENFRPISLRVGGTGTLRHYRQGVIRKAPLLSYVGENLAPQLTTLLARKYGLNSQKEKLEKTIHDEITDYHDRLIGTLYNYEETDPPGILINYWSPNSFISIPAQELVQAKKEPKLRNKIVLIGYTSFRRRDINFRDGTLVNTPWEGENNPEDRGTPLVFVTASLLENLLSGTWLENSSKIYEIGQTLLYVVLSVAIWRLAPTALALVLYLLIFGLLFYIHGLLFSFAHLAIPMANTLIFSILATIISTFWKAQRDHEKHTLRECSMRTQKELSQVQGRFLNRFAFELFDMNQKISQLLEPHQAAFANHNTLSKTFQKALASCSELKEYLMGIKHYSLLTQNSVSVVNKKNFPLEPLLQRILSQFEAHIEEKKIRILIENKGIHSVWSDEVLLEPILFNLISNAIKYSPNGGLVTIQVSQKRRQIAIDVQDEGCGIAKEYHSLIFEKFFRVRDDHSYRVKGNGLGLYLCHYFAERIGAKIQVESEPNLGSKFSLLLERKKTANLEV